MESEQVRRLKQILRNAVNAYEAELEWQDYESEEEMHCVVLHEFDMTQAEYNELYK